MSVAIAKTASESNMQTPNAAALATELLASSAKIGKIR